jgi:hypothetical protein
MVVSARRQLRVRNEVQGVREPDMFVGTDLAEQLAVCGVDELILGRFARVVPSADVLF